MNITTIRTLTFDGRDVGLRFSLEDRSILDADRQSLKEQGVFTITLDDKVELKLLDDILVSEEEIEVGVNATDVSNDKEHLAKLIESIHLSEKYPHLFEFKKPYELTLEDFLADEGWIPEKENRSDEHKNQHSILMPNGQYWRGGWIGTARSLYDAKKNFHYDQTRWALHRGESVSDEVLESYPHLKQFNDIITEIKQNIKVHYENSETIQVNIDGEERLIPLTSFPKTRLEQRRYVMDNELISKQFESFTSKLPSGLFDIRELLVIAFIRTISECTGQSIKSPHYA